MCTALVTTINFEHVQNISISNNTINTATIHTYVVYIVTSSDNSQKISNFTDSEIFV